MTDIISVIVTLTMVVLFVYGVSYFVSKVGNDDEQE